MYYSFNYLLYALLLKLLFLYDTTGSNKDYVVIGSDSGKISIVEFDATSNEWKTVHCEVFGKSGCRRIVPGQYVAADPKGRALMIGMLAFIYYVQAVISCNMSKLFLIYI